MLGSDVRSLDQLLAPSLIFTAHQGRVFGKDEDLDAHRSGLLRLAAIDVLDFKMIVMPETAVVSAEVRLKGSYAGVEFEGCFRYTRTWHQSADGKWQVIAGHASIVRPEVPTVPRP